MIDLAAEFPLDPALVHLNHAGVAPWPARTRRAVCDFADENTRLGSLHYPDWQAREARLRAQFAQLINAPSADDIALLKNTSEALSLVAFGLDWRRGDNVVGPAGEFPSNRLVWEALGPRFGVQYRAVPLDGQDDPEAALMAAVDGDTRLLAVSAVQYASGLRLDLVRLGEFCRVRSVLLCVDAIQQLGALPFDVQACQADFVAADGHKWLLGPEGMALFYCRSEARERLHLQQFGWHMVAAMGDFERRDWRPADSARRFEAGSPNNLGIAAQSASLSLLLAVGMPAVAEALATRVAAVIEQARRRGFPLRSPTAAARRAGIVTFHVPGVDNRRLYARLIAAGVLCAQRLDGLRFSPHFYTPPAAIEAAFERLDALR